MSGSDPDWPDPVTILNPGGSSDILLTCEHASNHIPARYGGLGLGPADLGRHIAWDIGAAAVTRSLSARLDAVAVLSGYSRLLIDLNRPLAAESAIPLRSEATDVPGNRDLSPDERRFRETRFHAPYHDALAALIDRRITEGRKTRILSVHSFTPVYLGFARPWHAGVLYARSARWGEALLAGLGAEAGLVVAANEPYRIERESDYTVPVHGEDRGLDAVLLEIRQDLIGTETGQAEWAMRLAKLFGDG